jgi:uncharacterized membrane protein YvbJ|tara:strand:+ start:1161 stop:1370 length:210 start_codon:yes stop_codon:yes gene_type:complete
MKIKKCIHCGAPNKEGWFYCKNCGKKASESKYTTNLWMISDMGKRTDVEISTQSMDQNMSSMRKRIGYG